MIIGVHFEIPQVVGNIILDILGCIDIRKYYWHNISRQTETWDGVHGDDFFDNENYSGYDFLSLIKNKHRIIFLKLQASSSCNYSLNINTYEEFKNSGCDIIMLIYDCEFVEVYAKSSDILKSILKRARELEYLNIGYIDNKYPIRTTMNIR